MSSKLYLDKCRDNSRLYLPNTIGNNLLIRIQLKIALTSFDKIEFIHNS